MLVTVGLAHLVFAVLLLLISGHTSRYVNKVGAKSFLACITGFGVWMAAGGINDLIVGYYGLRSPDGLIRVGALESVSSVVRFGFHASRIADSALQVLVPLAYALFVLTYTTRTDRSERKLLFALVPFGLIYTTGITIVGLVSLAPDIVPAGLRAMLSGGFLTFWQFAVTISLFATGAVVLLALGQLFRTLYRYQFVSTRLTLAVATIVPPIWLAEGFFIGVGETPVVRATVPLPFVAVGTVAAWLAVTRFGLFDELPAASAVARQDIVAGMSDAAIAVTNEGRVVDWNAAAADLFGQEYSVVVGGELATALPETFDTEALLAGEQAIYRLPESDRVLEASPGEITDERGRVLGHTLTVRDITDRRQNARRAEVLGRVLRHNIRNSVDIATAYLQQLSDDTVSDEVREMATAVDAELSELRELGTTAREIESVLQADRCADERSVEEMIRHAVDDVQQAHVADECSAPDGEAASVPVVIDTPSVTTRANEEIIVPVVRELVSNAVEHGGKAPEPHVTVRPEDPAGTMQAERWWIDVTDSGPGISDHEVEVFERAEEEPLHHGRGLGLWLVWWGVDRLGGEVNFTVNRGTTVTVELPESLFEHD